ncbi:MAG: bifunctional 2-C-methyl-D-erythritol 4-phosphate cytidylyltransferase/2-C-methyl-D-erythritol 2,4-cyclodiphosphate synthase [Rhodospirillales bacterium]|nr:bifunctional 2-C-methyl-D-erythritol 4-phosphate cytidylyltransferase/2-C-methyl-D-erythritol 2,4-cyclodiphosphate synthase [Rhodospirillales bacterium]
MTTRIGTCVALIVAGGRGDRFGADIPKQYCRIAGEPVLRRTVKAFVGHGRVATVRVVIRPGDEDLYAAATAGLAVMDPTHGGASRQESVRRGLESLAAEAPDVVLIHDAARPFVSNAVVSRVLDALDAAVGAIPAMPVVDTLKRASGAGDRVAATIERRGLWRAQTPQGFRFAPILDAHRRFAGTDLTDDAAVAAQAGLDVALVEGDEENVKITTREDLQRAEHWCAQGGETRTGFGFDVHRFGPGDHVTLCGVRIPFRAGLAGHSDADVGLHAITDALLGAIGGGDIGAHFPPGDKRWKNASSEIFLRHAGTMVADAAGRIVNIDVTLVCERPRIGPHRAAMIATIATVLGVPPERISVKATTTERLGFTGREEGIAAQAVATVVLPPPADAQRPVKRP